MISPVLSQELLVGGRRYQSHYLRWIYAGWLILQTQYYPVRAAGSWNRSVAGDFADFTDVLLNGVLVQHFAILVLLTPALVAGSISDEKARGTLQYLLTADLRPGEIILGKLLGRLYQVLLLVLVGLPM